MQIGNGGWPFAAGTVPVGATTALAAICAMLRRRS